MLWHLSIFVFVQQLLLLPELFHNAKLKLCKCESAPNSFLPETLATPFLFSVSMTLPTLGSSHKWNHIILVCVLLISLSITSLRFDRVVDVSELCSFLRLNISLYVYTILCLSINHKETTMVCPPFGYCDNAANYECTHVWVPSFEYNI